MTSSPSRARAAAVSALQSPVSPDAAMPMPSARSHGSARAGPMGARQRARNMGPARNSTPRTQPSTPPKSPITCTTRSPAVVGRGSPEPSAPPRSQASSAHAPPSQRLLAVRCHRRKASGGGSSMPHTHPPKSRNATVWTSEASQIAAPRSPAVPTMRSPRPPACRPRISTRSRLRSTGRPVKRGRRCWATPMISVPKNPKICRWACRSSHPGGTARAPRYSQPSSQRPSGSPPTRATANARRAKGR